ncbi:MAG: ECF transporter S component [Clostridia bacterium]|nr:ECF transporter S component [Clostridia bacterium]
MANNLKNRTRTRDLVLLAVFTALVVILQFLPIQIPGGIFSITLVLPVIVIGVAICGKWAGAWLGFVFATVVMLTGGADFFLFMNPPYTYITTPLIVYVKGIGAGLVAGIVYDVIKNKNHTVASIGAAVVSPIVNTGIYLIGCFLFFKDTVDAWLQGAENMSAFLFISLGLGNFLIELAVNLVLCPVIIRLVDLVVKKKISR